MQDENKLGAYLRCEEIEIASLALVNCLNFFQIIMTFFHEQELNFSLLYLQVLFLLIYNWFSKRFYIF